MSVQAFYKHFTSKEDAFLVAYEVGHGKGLATVQRAHEAEPDWRRGIRAAIAALFEFLAYEPSFAHLALVEALTRERPLGRQVTRVLPRERPISE